MALRSDVTNTDTSRLFTDFSMFSPDVARPVMGQNTTGLTDRNSALSSLFVQPSAGLPYATAPRPSGAYGPDQPSRVTGAVLGMPMLDAIMRYPAATSNMVSPLLRGGQQGPNGVNARGQTQAQWMQSPEYLQSLLRGILGNQQFNTNLQQQQQQQAPGGSSYASGIDQFLANLSGGVNGLQSIVANKGNPIDQLPAWQAALEAMRRNTEYGGANLAEMFNRGGNFFSTSFGNAMTDYTAQTAKDQNALLAQMLLQSGEGAAGRELSAANALGQLAFAGPSQLSGQAFQATQGDANRQLQAILQGAMGSDAAAQLMSQLGSQGAMALLGGSITGAQGLFGGENQAATNMYSSMMGLVPSYLNYDITGTGQQLSSANMLSNLLNQNLVTGSQLGGQQYNTLSNMIQAMQQNWNQQQPWNNPLLQFMNQAATGQAGYYYPQYQQSQWPALMGATGSIMGGLGPFLRALGLGGGG